MRVGAPKVFVRSASDSAPQSGPSYRLAKFGLAVRRDFRKAFTLFDGVFLGVGPE